ncbi:type VI secretion system baseplate subunit TssF [Ochrobactrum oryzae]|nr:type VI secretion system baseplate subunit TssF [Brucella oryzae]
MTADSISLNTTPVINLFQQRCEPVHVNGEREQYPFVPDYRFRQTRKFHSVDCVTAVSENGATILCHPAGHAKICSGSSSLVWQIVRDSSAGEDEDCMIGFSGSALDRGQSFVAQIEALCTNGQLPNQLPYNNGSLQLLPAKPHSMIAAIRCLMPFTSSVAKPLSGDQLWRFIAHLRVNHLSISNDTGQTLREILRLYQANEDADGQKFIDSVQSVTPRSSMYRLRQGGFAAATDFDICFSADTISPAGIFIFASVLNRFYSFTPPSTVSAV